MKKRLLTVLTAITAVSMLAATPPVSAGETGIGLSGKKYFLEDRLWAGACVITYAVEPGYGTDEYRPVIPAGLKKISENSGFVFKEVPLPGSAKDAQPNVIFRPWGAKPLPKANFDTPSPSYEPFAWQDGPEIILRPYAERKPAEEWFSAPPEVGNPIRQSTITHEMLHFLGISHPPRTNEYLDEIMYSGLPAKVAYRADITALGPGTTDALLEIQGRSQCQTGTEEWETPVPAASAIGKIPAFKAKQVNVKVPVNALYFTKSGKTLVATSVTRKATAKSDGKAVYVRAGDGKWYPVPYTYNARSNSLIYSEALHLRGLEDVGWGVKLKMRYTNS